MPELADVDDLDDLLDARADPNHTNRIGTGLIRQAAADGARDDEALLLLLHLLSGLVSRLTSQLADLSTDITTIVLSELTWRGLPRTGRRVRRSCTGRSARPTRKVCGPCRARSFPRTMSASSCTTQPASTLSACANASPN